MNEIILFLISEKLDGIKISIQKHSILHKLDITAS